MDPNEDIVISGISGRFPECNNVDELAEALLNGVDLITDDERRFPRGVMGIPTRTGKIPEMDKFDSMFFGVHAKQAELMDPRHRILCETVYECIVDAGFNPQELRGTRTGVYVGISQFTNPDKMRDCEDTDGYTNIGLSIAMAANRISYSFDFKGKSYSLDTACSSTMYGLVNAVEDMRSGRIDSAVVCGTNLILHPHESYEFMKLNMLAEDGKCKVFSTLRDGYARAEAVLCLLLQKGSDSRRVYASVVGALSNANGYTREGITFPCADMQLRLMEEIYASGRVDPAQVTYVEAHGTGTPAGDVQELQAIASMFCKNRKTPLPVGAVKSNMGHAEIASGLCSIFKVLIAMERGLIPANLHVDPLDTELPGIKEGQLKIVTENLPWVGDFVGLNCFGFGGANSHIALKSNPKKKTHTYKRPKYRLVLASGRTEESVNHFLDEVEKHQDDEEFLALVDDIHKVNCEGHNFRGYTILGEKPKRDVSRFSKAKPIWLIYAGMGSQWLGMGRDLMNNEIFRNTIKRCATALKPHGIDLEDVLTSHDPDTFENSANSFAGIGAVEIALTDLLYSMGIFPQGIAGHSLGEVGCSYADGLETIEEAILLAYARGYATQCVKLPAGLMAAVGLPKEECIKLLPEDIFIACQNGKNSVTITGPEKSTSEFVDKLTSQGIFARKVNSNGIAYHSKYISDSVPHLREFVTKALKTRKIRSPKWLSTSVKDNQKDEPWAQYNCVEYHTNNYVNTVLFDEVFKHVPEDAIVVEVAPHGLLQAILKRELKSNNTIIPLTNRNSPDNEEFFLSAIGKLYLAGGQPNLKKLYPGVSYPVSRGTKMISPLVKWDHSITWMIPVWTHKDNFGEIVRINISKDKHAYLAGHNLDGRVLMPATGYLDLAWRTFAHLHLKDMEDLPVVIEQIKFKRATVLPPTKEVQFLINITKQSGYFEIFEGGSVVCTGTISTTKDVSSAYYNANEPKVEASDDLLLTADDVYKECRLRRYLYEGCFQGITECDVQGSRGKVKWQGNFPGFLDTMIHLSIISETSRDLFLPTAIEKVVIDPREHLKLVEENANLPVFFNQNVNVIRSGAVEICGLDSSKVPRRKQVQEDPLLETYQFIPYESKELEQSKLDACLSVALQLILQNKAGLFKTLKICQLAGEESTRLIDKVKKILDSQPMVETEYVTYNKTDEKIYFDLVVLPESLLQETDPATLSKCLNKDGMLLYQGDIAKVTLPTLDTVYKATSGTNGIYLLRPKQELPSKYTVVQVKNSDFEWLEQIKTIALTRSSDVIFLVSQNEDSSGIVGLVKCLLAEPSTLPFRCVLIQDDKAATFSLDADFYREQLRKNLTFNVLRNGHWGSFVHTSLPSLESKQVDEASVSILTVGDLSTLTWMEQTSFFTKSDSASEKVYVCYSSLNFKDVMVATGKLQFPTTGKPTVPDISIGMEYAGITESGRRAMGLVGHEGLSLQLRSDPGFTWEVPKEWSLAEAATVPSVYATCYFAMIVRGRIQPGESILIHAGTGGIGIAAIAIALSMGCMVFTTVGSQEKREYLKKLYPQLNDANIGHSRSKSFRNMIMENTKGAGVDLVLNSLAGELFQESLRCLGRRGRFLEIGKVDFFNSTPINAKIFLRNCTFHSVHLDDLFDSNDITKQVINGLLKEGMKSGVVKPLHTTIFREDEVEDAFRFLSSGKHKGKVLIELRKEISATKVPIRTIVAIPKLYLYPDKSYILIGGLGGVGLELADWLIRRGATKIILNSRRQIYNGYQSYCLRKWSKWNGIVVKINTDDTTTLKGAQCLVNSAESLGPVGGVFNMALVLKDGLIENQTAELYQSVFGAKILSGQNMDVTTRAHCPQLDHFVVFSSVACGRGNIGQSNYGMANSALEHLCEKRRRDDLPALAVQWGAIGEVGALLKAKVTTRVSEQLVPQNISSCLEALERFMLQGTIIGSSLVLPSKTNAKNVETTKTPAEAVAHILGIRNLDVIDKSLTLAQLGLDSLMTAEIKQTLYRNYQLEIDQEEIKDLTFAKLMATSGSQQDNAERKNGTKEEVSDIVTAILSKEPIVAMNHAENGARTIFLIHPIQGHVEVLSPIAKQLNFEVFGLQCTKDVDFDNLQDYASYYITQIRSKQVRGPYLLCGYSFGTAVALEMGFQLEKDGDVAKIVSLDGSPAYVKTALEDLFLKHGKSVDRSKTAILVNFVSTVTSLDQEKVAQQLDAITDWQEQLRLVGKLVAENTGLDADLVALSADRYYKRYLAGFTYQPRERFKGRILLIRGDSSQVLSSEDYDLQKLCSENVEIMKLKGDHNTVLLGENVRIISKKINEFF